MTQSGSQAVEFSRLVPRDRLMEGECLHEIEASPAERQALAERFGLLALDRLWARLRLRPKENRGGERGLVSLSGRFEAELVQACVVSLEPLRGRLEEDVELLYSLAPRHREEAHHDGLREGEVVVSPDEAEPPEPVGPEGIDLGEAVAQQLAVTIDPYPRAPGAALEAAEWPPRLKSGQGPDQAPDQAPDQGPDGDDAAGPFAALRELKRGGS
jgi:hypothetical protein